MDPLQVAKDAQGLGTAAVVLACVVLIHKLATLFGPALAEKLRARAAVRLNGTLAQVVEEATARILRDVSLQDRIDARVAVAAQAATGRVVALEAWREAHMHKTDTGYERLAQVEAEVEAVKESINRVERDATAQRQEILAAINGAAERVEKVLSSEILRLREKSDALQQAVARLGVLSERDAKRSRDQDRNGP